MKKGWPKQTMQSLCEDVNVGHVGPSSMHRDPNGISFLMGKNVGTGVIYTHNIERVTEAFHRSQPKSRLRPGDIVVVRIGKSGQAAKIPEGFGEANCSGLVVIKQPHGIHPDFLVYYLNSPTGRGYSLSQARGSTRLTLNTSSVAETLVPVPPLVEQQRIVGLLDEAFEGLATAKANAEKNLQNARALFESHLQSVFTQRGPGWVETTLEKISINLDSKRVPITKNVRSSGEYPYYGASGIVDYVADYIFEGVNLLVSEDGANLLARSTPIAFSVSGKYWVNNHAHILHFENMATQRIAEFYLESIKLDDYITGAAQPKLNQKALNSIPIPIPKSVEAQEKIVARVESLREETQRLARLYERKHSALEALKKSLLHQAFTGEL